jgi:hypothetical protein
MLGYPNTEVGGGGQNSHASTNNEKLGNIFYPLVHKNSNSNDLLRRAVIAQSVKRWVTGWTIDSIPGGGWEFLSSPRRPERLWGPLSLLSNGYQRLFPWG